MKSLNCIAPAAALLLYCNVASAQPQAAEADRKLFREIYQELVEINTTDSVGDNTQAAQAMAARLKAADLHEDLTRQIADLDQKVAGYERFLGLAKNLRQRLQSAGN